MVFHTMVLPQWYHMKTWTGSDYIEKKIIAAAVRVMGCLNHPRKPADVLLRDVNVGNESLTSPKYEMLGWILPSYREDGRSKSLMVLHIFRMVYAGLTEPLEGPGLTKSYQLDKGHCTGEKSWRAAALKVLLCSAALQRAVWGQSPGACQKARTWSKKFFMNWFVSRLLYQSAYTAHVLKNYIYMYYT